MDTTNPLANGLSTPPPQADTLSIPLANKRKRSESNDQPPSTKVHDTSTANAPSDFLVKPPISPIYLDILDVFKQYDTTPSVLDHPIPDSSSRDDALSNKRVKLADGDAADTIASRIHHGLYSSLKQLQHDIADVCSAIIDPIKSRERQRNGARLPPDDIKTMQRVMAFQHEATGFLIREGKTEVKPQINGFKKEPALDAPLDKDQSGKTVLTLFGNAPTPKQLFSSFQHSTHAPSVKAEGVDLSLEEMGLPNMLNATTVKPLDPEIALGSRPKEPTFADVFPPPATLPQLNRPKAKSNTRSASIHWVTGDSLLPKPSRKNAYTMQPLNVGTWLDYGGRDADRESSGAIKRRRRESIVAATPLQKSFEDMSPAEIIAQEEALFKAAYSSFAPTVDNSKALVSDEIRDRVWWHKVGQKRFDKRFVLDPALDTAFPSVFDDDEPTAEETDVTLGSADELREFQEAVDNFDEDSFKVDNVISKINDDERSVDEMLKEISSLLETLASYQRIRNSYLVPADAPRNPTSPGALLAANVGTPTEPTKEEIATYKNLRSQLAQTIAKLPPYAVAKLDGEQLEDLAVNKTIIIKGKEFKGTMEEDHLTRMIRSTAAMQASAGPASVARPSTEYKSTASTYGRSSSMAQPPRSAHAPNPSYYSNNTRTPAPATSFNRAAPNYNTPSATGHRPSYGQAAGYPNTTTRPPSYGQGQTNGQPQSYRPGLNYGGFNGQQTPQAPSQTPAAYGTQQQYRNTTAYGQNTAMPATPSYTGQQNTQPRPNYGTAPTQYMQQRPNGQSQQPNMQGQQGQQQQSNSGRATPNFGVNAQTPSALGPSGFHTSMTSEQQQMMMERQRAQLAQQPIARMQAQADIQRMASSTPQPQPPPQQPQQNGDASRGGANGTPMVV